MKYNLVHQVQKVYPHSEGLSVCFRQWRADSHCHFMHGYALQIEVTFSCSHLDDKGWVIDFGGLKIFKEWLRATFDHKTLVAEDDPELDTFKMLADKKIVDLLIVQRVGCEAFASAVMRSALKFLDDAGISTQKRHVWVSMVKVKEHEGNAAIVHAILAPDQPPPPVVFPTKKGVLLPQ